VRVKVARSEVPVAAVYFRERKYGGGSNGLPSWTYELTAGLDELVAAVEPYYRDYAEDDVKFGIHATPLDLELRRLRWPGLRELADGHPRLLQRFLSENASQVIQALFTAQQLDPDHRYVINSVKAVRGGAEDVTFEGEVIEIPRDTPRLGPDRSAAGPRAARP